MGTDRQTGENCSSQGVKEQRQRQELSCGICIRPWVVFVDFSFLLLIFRPCCCSFVLHLLVNSCTHFVVDYNYCDQNVSSNFCLVGGGWDGGGGGCFLSSFQALFSLLFSFRFGTIHDKFDVYTDKTRN